MTILAITGGTGFVGRRLIDLALAEGHHLRALTRREQPPREGVTWVSGALDQPDSLKQLATGAEAVIHVAGVVNAPDRAGFAAGNIAGTANMLATAQAAGVSRFVHISSLSAREPQLSSYGWSKAQGDRLVMDSALDWTILRPPAIYGPGDHEMLELFRLANKGFSPHPAKGRISIIHVDDLVRLILALALTDGPRTILEASDGTANGLSHREFAQALGKALNQRVHSIPLPKPLLGLIARGDRLVRGNKAKLTPDRVDYFCHPDWTADPDKAPPAQLWQPMIPPETGLAETASWYRAQGLL